MLSSIRTKPAKQKRSLHRDFSMTSIEKKLAKEANSSKPNSRESWCSEKYFEISILLSKYRGTIISKRTREERACAFGNEAPKHRELEICDVELTLGVEKQSEGFFFDRWRGIWSSSGSTWRNTKRDNLGGVELRVELMCVDGVPKKSLARCAARRVYVGVWVHINCSWLDRHIYIYFSCSRVSHVTYSRWKSLLSVAQELLVSG